MLRLLAAGLSNAEIAANIHLGVETVRTHVRNILGKLGFAIGCRPSSRL